MKWLLKTNSISPRDSSNNDDTKNYHYMQLQLRKMHKVGTVNQYNTEALIGAENMCATEVKRK